MSPIENVVPNLEPQPLANNGDTRIKQNRSRDLFGVQLEVSKYIPTNIFSFLGR